jgi:hypothetical protein
MDLTTLPWRTYEKYRRDGLVELLDTGWETLFVDILCYRIGYRHALRPRLSVLSRDDVRNRTQCRIYDAYDGTVQYKGARGRGDPETDPTAGYQPGDRFVCRFDRAQLLGPLGVGLTDDDHIIADTAGTPPLAQRRIGIGIAKSMATNGVRRTVATLSGSGDPDERFGEVAVAIPPWNNYYHWTMECLAKIRLLDRYAERHGEHPELLIPADRPSWMDETLDHIAYGGTLVPWDGGIAHVDHLVVPTFPDPIPAECRWLRDRMRQGIDTSADTPARIYISREDATARKVRNADEVGAVLDTHGFETYVLSELTVAEQIRLFANADCVVSPHGAGLTNVVYSDDVSIVELFGDERVATFARLATMLDHDYRNLDCEQRGVNVVVDPERLDAAIRDALD